MKSSLTPEPMLWTSTPFQLSACQPIWTPAVPWLVQSLAVSGNSVNVGCMNFVLMKNDSHHYAFINTAFSSGNILHLQLFCLPGKYLLILQDLSWSLHSIMKRLHRTVPFPHSVDSLNHFLHILKYLFNGTLLYVSTIFFNIKTFILKQNKVSGIQHSVNFKGYTPILLIIKYWLYSLCCTI